MKKESYSGMWNMAPFYTLPDYFLKRNLNTVLTNG